MAEGHYVCMHHGAWRRGEDGFWSFIRRSDDLVRTIFVKSTESIAGLENLVRERYKFPTERPMVLSYYPPDWMLEPDGTRTPPTNLTTNSQVETMMGIRSWFPGLILCVSSGAEDVAHFQFLSETTFSVGGATFVFTGYTGEEIVASKEILQEIFNEEEMVAMVRAHLEIEKTKQGRRGMCGSGSVPGSPSAEPGSGSSPPGSGD